MKMPQKPKPYLAALPKALDLQAGNEGAIIELVQRYNEDYVHWDELRRKEVPIEPEALWALMKMARAARSRRISFNDIHVSYCTTNGSQRIMYLLDTASSGLTGPEGSLGRHEMDRFVDGTLMEEAIASSQIEGAVTATNVAKRMLRENRKPKTHSERMIVNDYVTMQSIRELKGEKLTPSLVLELHRAITDGTLDDPSFEGRFRTANDIVVADILEDRIIHDPPPAAKVPSYIDKICDFINADGASDFHHPLIKTIILHFMIGYVHPFVDGNGRLARALMYWYCLKKNYWLVEHLAISTVIKESKGRYGMAYLYAETDDNDVTYFINYNLWCMEKALLETRRYISGKWQERQVAIELVRSNPDLNSRQAEILRDMMRHKGEQFSILEVASKFNVVRQTARTDLIHLEAEGFLRSKKVGKKIVYTYLERSKSEVV